MPKREHEDTAITDKVVRSLESPETGYDIRPDGGPKRISGFGVLITAAGHRSFVLRYRNEDGRPRRYTIGAYGPDQWSVAAARKRAGELKKLINRGEDPNQDKQQARAAPTMKDLCDDYETRHLPKNPAPRVVLLDEPFASLDAARRDKLRDELCGILRAARTTAIVVTHDQEEALSIADHVAVMLHGRVQQMGTPEQIYLRPATVEVAEFVGGGQLVDCRIDNGTVNSAFGPLATDAPDGPGKLLLRPEVPH